MTSMNSSLQNKLAPNLSLLNENKLLEKGAKRGQELKLAFNGETKLPFVGGGLEGWNNPVKKQLEESDGSDKCFP